MAVLEEGNAPVGTDRPGDILEEPEHSCTEADRRGQEDQGADHGHHTAWEVDRRSWRIHSRQDDLDRRPEPSHLDHTRPKQGRMRLERKRDGTGTAG